MRNLLQNLLVLVLVSSMCSLQAQDISASVTYTNGTFNYQGPTVDVCPDAAIDLIIDANVTCAGRGGVDESFYIRNVGGTGYERFTPTNNQISVSVPTDVRYCVRCNDGAMLESNILRFIPRSQITQNGISIDCATLVLPVELTAFSGKASNNIIQLDWQTASEQNNDGFEIQHSANARNWDVVEFVAGVGTTNELQSYSYNFKSNRPGVHYFRLKQMDFDGQFEFSDIIQVKVQEVIAGQVIVFPNPANEKVTIGINNLNREAASIRVVDLRGSVVFEQVINASDAVEYYEKELTDLAQGTYFVKTMVGTTVATKKINVIARY